ncbi:MAG: DUF86 domain-containing protein [Geminicoccaceae bacterium]
MIDEVLISKAESIERCLERVRSTYIGHEADFAESYDLQDIIVLNLQRACEAAIDMANRMIRLRRLRYPRESKESFDRLVAAGLLTPELGETMGRMVGFRNIAVHEYQELDIEKVRHIVEHRLADVQAFSTAMLRADPGG